MNYRARKIRLTYDKRYWDRISADANRKWEEYHMNIEEGTRVRSTESQYPDLTEGTYMGKHPGGEYYLVQWDGIYFPPGPWMHLLGEFEVIDDDV